MKGDNPITEFKVCGDCTRPYKEACDIDCPRLYESRLIKGLKIKETKQYTQYVEGRDGDVYY